MSVMAGLLDFIQTVQYNAGSGRLTAFCGSCGHAEVKRVSVPPRFIRDGAGWAAKRLRGLYARRRGKAAIKLSLKFNRCVCGKYVCDDCCVIPDDGSDVLCKECAEKKQASGRTTTERLKQCD